jgi:hypothetical protein
MLAGCQTPDLKPFASATAGVTASIAQGGDLAIKQIAREPAIVDNDVVDPDAPNHPAKAIATEWETRRRAAEAILAYSGALAAIGDAAANRKANATALFDSVKQLESAVPGVSHGSNTAGNLLISAASGIVEIKAWRDMGDAVKNADAAIGIIAGVFRKDLELMAKLHAGFHTNQITQAKVAAEYRQLIRLHEALRKEQQTKRANLAGAPGDANAGTELARIDALITGVEHDLNPRLAAIARHRAALAEGATFYKSAIDGVEAWAAAHHDLAQAFEQKRTPNIALLIARAQEIQGQLQELKSANHQPATP